MEQQNVAQINPIQTEGFPRSRKKIWTIIISAVVFLVCLFAAYFFLFRPYYNKQQLAGCLASQKTTYLNAWAQDCKKYNRPTDKSGLCTLNKTIGDSMNKIYDNQKNICNTKFK